MVHVARSYLRKTTLALEALAARRKDRDSSSFKVDPEKIIGEYQGMIKSCWDEWCWYRSDFCSSVLLC